MNVPSQPGDETGMGMCPTSRERKLDWECALLAWRFRSLTNSEGVDGVSIAVKVAVVVDQATISTSKYKYTTVTIATKTGAKLKSFLK